MTRGWIVLCLAIAIENADAHIEIRSLLTCPATDFWEAFIYRTYKSRKYIFSKWAWSRKKNLKLANCLQVKLKLQGLSSFSPVLMIRSLLISLHASQMAYVEVLHCGYYKLLWGDPTLLCSMQVLLQYNDQISGGSQNEFLFTVDPGRAFLRHTLLMV